MEAVCDVVQGSASIISGWVPGEGDRGVSGTSKDHKVTRSGGGLWERKKGDEEAKTNIITLCSQVVMAKYIYTSMAIDNINATVYESIGLPGSLLYEEY